MSTGELRTAKAMDGTDIHFETHGDRRKPAIFMGPHFYSSRFAEDGSLGSITETWIDALKADFFLIVADYPRGIGRTGNPQGLEYSPEIAAQECECIADAAGVQRFGWIGYSFGGALGVQVACRSTRIAALAVGGFPPLNAPFDVMLKVVTDAANEPPLLPKLVHPGVLWSSVGFYKPLVTWPERRAVRVLTMPRLVFMGDEDAGQGSSQPIPLAQSLRAAEGELRVFGWQIVWLQGHDHISAVRPEVSLPAVHRFFRDALPVQ